MAINLNFKYGEGDLPGLSNDTKGTVYIKRTSEASNPTKDNGRAKLYIDTPGNGELERLVVGGDVFVGSSTDPAAASYDVVIDPNGDVVNNAVISADEGGFIIKVVSPSNPDTYDPASENFSRNTIVLVTES